MQKPTIYFVTTNAGKLREAKDLFKDNFEVEQVNATYPELQEDDLSKIAAYGARYCADSLRREVIVEDSGLFIDALKGFPGPYSSYVQKTLGNKGILKLMEGVEGRAPSSAPSWATVLRGRSRPRSRASGGAISCARRPARAGSGTTRYSRIASSPWAR